MQFPSSVTFINCPNRSRVTWAIALADVDRLVQVLEAQGFYIPGTDDIKAGRMRTLGITHIESISRADLMLSGQ
jgi:hypothetical protein